MNANMSTKRMKLLIERFFEGETTLGEEQAIYAYFRAGDVDEELEPMREMFLDFSALETPESLSEEGTPASVAAEVPLEVSGDRTSKFRWWKVAAAIAVVLTLTFGTKYMADVRERDALAAQYGGSYMIVDGKRIDDLTEIRTHLEQVLASADRLEKQFGGRTFVQEAERDLLGAFDDPIQRAEMKRLLNE